MLACCGAVDLHASFGRNSQVLDHTPSVLGALKVAAKRRETVVNLLPVSEADLFPILEIGDDFEGFGDLSGCEALHDKPHPLVDCHHLFIQPPCNILTHCTSSAQATTKHQRDTADPGRTSCLKLIAFTRLGISRLIQMCAHSSILFQRMLACCCLMLVLSWDASRPRLLQVHRDLASPFFL